MRKGAQLKVDNGSLLVIKTKMEKRDDLKSFLVVYPGYYHVTEDRDSKDEDSVTLKVQYINYYFNYGERRRLKQSIEYIGGNLERIMILGRGPPWIREETKQSLTNGAIMAVITFLVSVGGSKAITTLDLDSIIGLALIPSLTAFFSRLAIDRNLSPPQ